MNFNIDQIRSHFPALSRIHPNIGQPLIYFDAPGGTQVTQSCIDAMAHYLAHSNANTHGAFITSEETDQVIAGAHEVAADFLNARSGNEIIFGQNMTSLTFSISRTIGVTLKAGDEIILTRLDHDANYSPWHLMAQERGVVVHVVDIHEADCTLNLDDFERYLSKRTKLVAVGCASNSVGTINPVEHIIGMARAASAMTYLDAVHFAPHAPIDVQALNCDFLVCSAYKFWGPHLGLLYGRYDLLDPLPAFKVRPAASQPPHKFETGTQSFEAQAGLIGTMQYVEWLAGHIADGGGKASALEAKNLDQRPEALPLRSNRAKQLHSAMRAAQEYELSLTQHLIEGLRAIRGVRIYGITDPARYAQRTPTASITITGKHPRAIAEELGKQGICVWDGNYYAVNLSERLGVESTGGMVRIGLTHYNTHAEIDRLLNALA